MDVDITGTAEMQLVRGLCYTQPHSSPGRFPGSRLFAPGCFSASAPGSPLHFFFPVAAHCHSCSVAPLPAQARWSLGIHFPFWM